MKRPAFLLAALMLLCPAWGYTDELERTLSVSASATTELEPDLNITLAVETIAPNARESAAGNARQMENVISAVRKGLDEKDRIATSSYGVFPVYEYQKDRGQALIGFRTINQTMGRPAKTKSAGDILDRAVGAGANRVEDVSFDVADTSKACEGLIRKASADAASQARVAAESFGATLNGVKSLFPTCGKETNGPVRPMAIERMKAPETPVEPGAIRVRAAIDAVYYLK